MTDLLETLVQSAPTTDASRIPTVSLRAMVEWFYADGAARNLAPGTITFYRYQLRYLLDAAGDRLPQDVTLQHLRLITEHFREKRQWTPCTTNHFITALKAFFAYLVKEEVLSANPADGLTHLKDDAQLPDPLTSDEMKQILGACRDTFCGVRDRTIFLTLLDTGIRLGELTGLAVDDIDLALQQIHIRKSKSRRERLVPFSSATRRALVRYLTQRAQRTQVTALWVTESGTPMTRWYLVKRIEGVADSAKVNGFHIHRLRHTMATEFLRNGGNAMTLQRILGHSTTRMTQRYVHLTDADAQADHVAASPVERWRLESTHQRSAL